jgi:hypothetical protein
MAVLEPYPGTTVYLWNYVPNLPAAIIFAVLYLTMSCLISLRMYKTDTWFCSAFAIGCFSKSSLHHSTSLLTVQFTVEVVGYIGRVISVNNTGGLGPYVIQATFILLPPAFFATSIYMILARIIRSVDGDHLSIINPRLCYQNLRVGRLDFHRCPRHNGRLWVASESQNYRDSFGSHWTGYTAHIIRAVRNTCYYLPQTDPQKSNNSLASNWNEMD